MKYEPTRMCVACRSRKQKSDLLKIVAKNGVLSVVLNHTEGSRGTYICKNIECLNLAIKKKVLNRILKKEIDASFYDELKGYCCGENK